MVVALSLCATAGFSAINVLEGFEVEDALNWQATSPTPQTHNATNSGSTVTPTFSTSNVTEGTKSGEFIVNWTLPGTAAVSNPHISGGPLTFWSIRYNVNAPAGNANNTVTANSRIQADFYNNNPYPIQVALVLDSAASTQLERGPFVTLPANSATLYDWNVATVPAVGWVTGDGVITFPARLKTMVLYTDVEPTAGTSSVFVDNIRDITAQTDVTAPVPPSIYSATQGAAPGDILVRWKANTEPDLAGYRIYVAQQNEFHTPTFNRITFPSTPAATVAAGVTQVTLPGQPTNAIVYVKVTAFDNATPTANESDTGEALAVNLRPDGAAPADRVVMDLNRNTPGTSAFTTEGYFHGIAYNGEALHALGRNFDSIAARAIDEGIATLTPNPLGVVIWANMLDGTVAASVALSNPSIAALTSFVGAGGDLIMSGAGTAEDLSTRTPESQAFLANVLKASLINPNAAVGDVTLNTAPLASAGAFTTNLSVFAYVVGFQTASNEVLDALPGAVLSGAYTGITPGGPAVLSGNSVVFFGFGLESAGVITDTAAARLVRQNIVFDAINYLKAADVADWNLY